MGVFGGVTQPASGECSYRRTDYICKLGQDKQSIAIVSQTCFKRGCPDDEGVSTALGFE